MEFNEILFWIKVNERERYLEFTDSLFWIKIKEKEKYVWNLQTVFNCIKVINS